MIQEVVASDSPDTVISLLRKLAVERQTGELLVQHGDHQGKIYLQDGVVLWAFASGQRESFQSILLRENRISKDRLVEGIRQSRESGKKGLDEILLMLGIDSREMRQGLVLRHTQAAISTILSWGPSSARLLPRGSGALSQSPETIRFDVEAVLRGVQPTRAPEPKQIPVAPPVPEQELATAPTPRASRQPVQTRSLEELLSRLHEEIPSFLAAMVIDGKTGMPIASETERHDLDIEIISAYYKNIIQSADDALMALGRETDDSHGIDEILITCKEDYALLKLLKPSGHILYVLVESQGNPAQARIIVRRYLDQLNGFVM